ncbi:MAG: hypothetical protein N2C14_13110 [Planctomycetales bacterium]
MDEYFAICLVLAGIAFAWFWILQFIQLMTLDDSDFPGTHDKALWVAAFICVFLLAPLAFIGWKKLYVAVRAETMGGTKKHS